MTRLQPGPLAYATPTTRFCRVTRNAALSVVNGTATTVIPWDTLVGQTDTFITVTANGITVPAGLAGWYLATLRIITPVSLSWEIYAAINANDMMMANMSFDAGAVNTNRLQTLMVPLAAGDTLGWKVRHNSGSAQNITGSFDIIRLYPL